MIQSALSASAKNVRIHRVGS